jgi:hypothetical protein
LPSVRDASKSSSCASQGPEHLPAAAVHGPAPGLTPPARRCISSSLAAALPVTPARHALSATAQCLLAPDMLVKLLLLCRLPKQLVPDDSIPDPSSSSSGSETDEGECPVFIDRHGNFIQVRHDPRQGVLLTKVLKQPSCSIHQQQQPRNRGCSSQSCSSLAHPLQYAAVTRTSTSSRSKGQAAIHSLLQVHVYTSSSAHTVQTFPAP